MTKRLLAALMLLALGATNTHAEEDVYYKLTPEIAVTAWVDSGEGLYAEMVTNMKQTNIIGAPHSIAVKIEGSCSLREYVITGTALFSGRMRGGYIVDSFPSDGLRRRVPPRSNVAKLFDRECPK